MPFSGTADLQIALLASSNWISCLVSVRVRWGAPAPVVMSSSPIRDDLIIQVQLEFLSLPPLYAAVPRVNACARAARACLVYTTLQSYSSLQVAGSTSIVLHSKCRAYILFHILTCAPRRACNLIQSRARHASRRSLEERIFYQWI